MTIIISQCDYCKHSIPGSGCKAFPDEIPEYILFNKYDHSKPFPGDGGITFEPIDLEAQKRHDVLDFYSKIYNDPEDQKKTGEHDFELEINYNEVDREMDKFIHNLFAEHPEPVTLDIEPLPKLIFHPRGIQPSQCPQCKHYIKGTLKCEAFPGGIPKEILHNEIEHNTPYPNDNGIQFEPKN